ncbi:Thioredoxin-like protein 1 [Araneus ventricosus]|uniref:Thioredoxin-like protein 1 n=1 Tax=Araneus ventricosus TaxID=182803 RepID=A0A4Y2IEJ8_ARAVE|nr:Thioredoxin-like protein 1 [Araneus ventricosus]
MQRPLFSLYFSTLGHIGWKSTALSFCCIAVQTNCPNLHKKVVNNGPKTLKLFINQPRTLDFDQADSSEPVQILELKPEDLTGEKPILLRYVKFQNVQNLQIFVKDNQTGAETTRINHLAIIGSTISMTNMGDFKRVAGKKGESH